MRWPGLVALALTSTSLAFGAMFLSPGRTGAGIASVLGNLQPLFVLVLAAVILGEVLSAAKARALGVALAGAVFGERLGASEFVGLGATVAGVGIATLRPSPGPPGAASTPEKEFSAGPQPAPSRASSPRRTLYAWRSG